MLTAFLVLAFAASEPRDHVSFLVMGKTSNHRQSESGELRLLNYHFFSEIFVREGGRVSGASLRFPGEGKKTQSFEDRGPVLELHGGRFDAENALDFEYPAGDYVIRFETPGGPVEGRILPMRGSRIPKPPRITLVQDGMDTSPQSIDPAKDLTVRWSEFEGARSAGILDDLVFVVIGDCHAERVVHSGRPFERTPFLTYRQKQYTVPGGKLAPGEAHQMFVEHASVDTTEEDGIVALVTYASTTFLDFHTLGSPAGRSCPEVMPPFDGGQTDRKRP